MPCWYGVCVAVALIKSRWGEELAPVPRELEGGCWPPPALPALPYPKRQHPPLARQHPSRSMASPSLQGRAPETPIFLFPSGISALAPYSNGNGSYLRNRM